ncbi:MAG: hypothetical protein K2X80_16180 [Pseudomonadaceae bacterium]|nr:hypothetical protein [Pseudomonadaceae bacterium]
MKCVTLAGGETEAMRVVERRTLSLMQLGDRLHWETSRESAMSNAEQMKITQTGRVTITSTGIGVEGFSGDNAGCRELAIMATAWAIGELQREMLKTIEKPGGGNISVD